MTERRRASRGALRGIWKCRPKTRAPTALDLHSKRGDRASMIELGEGEDPVEYCFRVFKDALPVVPPTGDRVMRMVARVGARRPGK